MQHAPVPIVERITVYAEDAALVAFAASCRWLWQCASLQQRVWHQRFQKRYSLEDDREMQWLCWYVRTLRLSGLLSPSSQDNTDMKRLSDYDINWFRAFCHRRATDARWFNESTYKIREPLEIMPANASLQVLQRIPVKNSTIGNSGVMEQCQVIGCPDQQSFWRMRKFCLDGIDPTISVSQLCISDMFVVAYSIDLLRDTDQPEEKGGILVWLIHRVADMSPYCIPRSCNNSIDLRG
jgi:hypothetical protein